MGINPNKGKNIVEIASPTKPFDKIYGMVIESAFSVIWYSDITSLLDYLGIVEEDAESVDVDVDCDTYDDVEP